MLYRGDHHHFARKQPLAGERRLLRATKDDDDDDDNATVNREGGAENAEGGKESAGKPASPVEDMTEGFGERIRAQENATLEKISKSSTVLLAIVEGGMLPRDMQTHLEEKMRAQDATLPSTIPLWKIIEYVRAHPELQREITDCISTILTDPHAAIAIGQELEERMRQYRNLEHMLTERYGNVVGPIDLEKIEKFQEDFERIFAKEGYSLRDFIAGTNERFARVNEKKILAFINEKFGLKRDPVSPDAGVAAGGDGTGKKQDGDSRVSLAQRFLNAFKSARLRKLANTAINLGRPKEERIDQTRTLGELEQQLLALKKHIDNMLQSGAQKMNRECTERMHRKFFHQKNHDSIRQRQSDTGITPEELATEVLAPALTLPQRILRLLPDDAREGEEFDTAPDVEDENYLMYAARAAKDMTERKEWEAQEARRAQEESRPPRDFEDMLFEQAQKNHGENIAWARQQAPIVEKVVKEYEKGVNAESMQLLQQLLQGRIHDDGEPFTEQERADVPKLLKGLNESLQEIAGAETPSRPAYDTLFRTVDRWGRENITWIVDKLANPETLQDIGESMEQRAKRTVRENSEENREDIEQRLRGVRKRLFGDPDTPGSKPHAALQLTVSTTFQLPDIMRQKIGQATSWLDAAATFAETEGHCARSKQKLNDADELTAILERCADRMDEIMDEKNIHYCSAAEFEAIVRKSGNGAFLRKSSNPLYDGKIIINEDLHRPEHIAHEQGHALLHVLTKETGLIVGLHAALHSSIKNGIPDAKGETRNIHEILLARADPWGIPRSGNEKTDLETLMDELMNQYATWVDKGRPWKEPPTDNEILFEYMDKETGNAPSKPEHLAIDEEAQLPSVEALMMRDDDDDDAKPAGPQAASKIPDSSKELRDTLQELEKIRIFYDSYPEFKAQLEPYYNQARKEFDIIEKAYNTDKKVPTANIIEALGIIKKFIGPIVKEIGKIGGKRLDLSEEEPTGKLTWRTLARGMTFLSIIDIVHVAQQTWEDLGRIWKRRGEAKEAGLGEGITSWIPDAVPYAGRLKNEFRKRSLSSELEEVSHWKEALKDQDSYGLQDLLRVSRNKDQVRAICELLSERGRIDWNDTDMWETFNALSRYEMPKKACQNDAVLRDRWLQKLVTDIWGDKDHFNGWRQANDSGIKSGMSKFTPLVDQLANVPHGMDGTLSTMLETFVNHKNDPGNMPEAVQPHLYEELVFYAMRNGKMTMEAKFFYLIQGIRHGLISVDRLGVIAGEGGKILNTFPFIDYFYKRNNTMAQITALGERLEEKGDRFKPGLKSTLFVRMEIEREDAVKERLRKGVSKQGENIDHDDIPYFLPALDHSGIKEWFANMSGARQKLSKEALKNAYVGYSMKFKTFAALATMDKEGIKRFSETDVRDMAQTIGAYVTADNLLTRNAFDKDDTSRPELSLSEINTQTPVMGAKNATVKNYRDNLQFFVQSVLQKFLGDENSDAWTEINKAAGIDIAKKGSKDWITQEDFAGKDPEENRNNGHAEKVWKGTSRMISLLEEAMMRRPDEFKQMLIDISMQSNRISANNQFFLEDGVQEFTNTEALETMKDMGGSGSMTETRAAE